MWSPPQRWRSWRSSDNVVGVVISASHNVFSDNGIKIFAPGGSKLSDGQQARIEALLDELDDVPRPTGGAAVGTVAPAEESAAERYLDSVIGSLEGRRLEGIEVVVDCAHGANSGIAGAAFERLGATTSVINETPDGININAECGSNHPEALRRAVLDAGADVGFAFDGDADRVVAVGADGELLDGDQLMAIAAVDLRSRGLLTGDQVVITVMTNLGFPSGNGASRDRGGGDSGGGPPRTPGPRHRRALAGRRAVGPHHTSEIWPRPATVLRAAVVLADVMVRSGRPLRALADDVMQRLPQVLINVRLADRPADLMDQLAPAIAAAEQALADAGRVLVMESGTEPLVRVMVEATDHAQATTVAETLVAAVDGLTR